MQLMSMVQGVYLSVCLSVCLSPSHSVYLSVCLSVSLSQQSSGIQGMDEFCRQLDVFVEYRFVVRQTVDVTNPPGQVSVHHRSQLTVTQLCTRTQKKITIYDIIAIIKLSPTSIILGRNICQIIADLQAHNEGFRRHCRNIQRISRFFKNSRSTSSQRWTWCRTVSL